MPARAGWHRASRAIAGGDRRCCSWSSSTAARDEPTTGTAARRFPGWESPPHHPTVKVGRVRRTPAPHTRRLPMQLPIRSLDDAPSASRPVLEGIAADLGLVPNLAGTAAGSPALLAGFDGLRRAVGSAGLDPVLREVTGLAVGVVVDNHYGIAFHSTMLAGLGMDETDIDAIRAGNAPADAAAAAVHALAAEAVEQRGKVADTTVARVEAAGLDHEAILEILLEVAFASMVGLIDNLAGHVELDEFLQPRALA